MREWKKIFIGFSALVLFFVFSFSLMYYEKNDFEKQYFQIVDVKSSEDYRTLLNQENILERLKSFNNELKEYEKFIFIEFMPNVVEFIGEWDKPEELANGYGHKDLTNQTVKIGEKKFLITPVNCLTLDKTAMNLYSLNISDGGLFLDEDFILKEKELPLILGSGFQEYYSLGEEIPLLYFSQEWTGVVKGFLEEDQFIKQDWTEYSLNNMILVPSFDSISDEIDIEFQKLLYYAKTGGYLILEDKSNYPMAKKEIKKLSQEYNLPYELLRGY